MAKLKIGVRVSSEHDIRVQGLKEAAAAADSIARIAVPVSNNLQLGATNFGKEASKNIAKAVGELSEAAKCLGGEMTESTKAISDKLYSSVAEFRILGERVTAGAENVSEDLRLACSDVAEKLVRVSNSVSGCAEASLGKISEDVRENVAKICASCDETSTKVSKSIAALGMHHFNAMNVMSWRLQETVYNVSHLWSNTASYIVNIVFGVAVLYMSLMAHLHEKPWFAILTMGALMYTNVYLMLERQELKKSITDLTKEATKSQMVMALKYEQLSSVVCESINNLSDSINSHSDDVNRKISTSMNEIKSTIVVKVDERIVASTRMKELVQGTKL